MPERETEKFRETDGFIGVAGFRRALIRLFDFGQMLTGLYDTLRHLDGVFGIFFV